MPTSLIIGSGPAAAGAAAALFRDPNESIVVLDVGTTLDEGRLAVVRKMSSQDETAWSQHDLDLISQHAIANEQGALPEKRTYGSNYPFRDSGQLQGVEAKGGANRSVISGAYGGFSKLWGAQIMPFSAPRSNDGRSRRSKWRTTIDSHSTRWPWRGMTTTCLVCSR